MTDSDREFCAFIRRTSPGALERMWRADYIPEWLSTDPAPAIQSELPANREGVDRTLPA